VWEDTTGEGKEDFRDMGYPIEPDGDIDTSASLQHGGRKTNGTAITEPMKVLYDGPRRFIAVVSTTIYDHINTPEHEDDIPVAKITITIIFNKVKKYVILLKDVKSLLPAKLTDQRLIVQFSNRGEVDLYTEKENAQMYAHFFTKGKAGSDTVAEGFPTVYNEDWELVETTDVGDTGHIGPEPPATNATYDVAQVVNYIEGKVFFAAFWPSLSDWEMFGWDMWYRSLTEEDPHTTDHPDEPRVTPFYIGEWDFILDPVETATHWRGVTVYGVVDLHNAQDDKVDKEIKDYQLKEVFEPWDLARTLNPCKKKYKRWVEFFTGDGSTTEFPLKHEGVVAPRKWWAYCVFAERVLVDGVLKARPDDYDVIDKDGDGLLDTINFTSPPPDGATIKVLYSTYTTKQKVESFTDVNVTGDAELTLKHKPIVGVDFVMGRVGDSPWFKITGYTVDTSKGVVKITEYPPSEYETTEWDEVKIVYKIPDARYEWIVVGRDLKKNPETGEVIDLGARTPDVLAAGYVAAAMKNKNFELWYMGLDRNETAYDKVPYVMSKLVADGDKWENYIDELARPAFRDDWCTTIPISSANIITVGGPGANLATEYFNEFTDAFFIWPARTPAADLKGKIFVPTCWSKYAYKDTIEDGELRVGYAIIATYKDLNGTVGLVIWGLTGTDTYWAAKWFHDHILGIECPDIQNIKPGITAIVLEITYDGCKPVSIDIIEWVGTISETTWPASDQEPPHPDP
ncbi:MAG: hypothetical protein DRJ51_08705, partial [Thermoprotei archaeon]